MKRTPSAATKTVKPSAAVSARAVSAKSRSAAKDKTDAIALLTDDHKKVKKMFKDFEKLSKSKTATTEEKALLVEAICMELKVHTSIEEEIFYPAVRVAIKDDDMLDEADVEHASAKDLIAQLEAAAPGDDHYDAKVTVLGEYINHHVEEEESEMFPKVQKSKLDTAALGSEMQTRKQQLMNLH